MAISSILGVCSSQFVALDCDGNPDTTVDDIVFCGLTQVSVTPVLTDSITIQDPSGIPGEFCLDIEVDPEVRYYDVTVTTCSLFDPRLDNLLGESDLMETAAGVVYGSKAKPKQDQTCLCQCGDDTCMRRTGLVIWSLNLCPNSGGFRQFHPDGRNMVTVFPAIRWRRTTNPRIQLSATAQGRQYVGRTYENPFFGQGPGAIIPADQAPFDRCYYQFPTDECPPGGCDCGDCGAESPTPLAFV